MSYHCVFPKYRKAGVLPGELITKFEKPDSCLELAMVSVSRSSVFYFTIGLGLTSITLLGTNLSGAIAQMPSTAKPMSVGERTISQVNVLFVNPGVGDDKNGNGSEATPLKTITQALRVASANTVIRLSTGTYSTGTGEIFPLILKSGVSIQGDASTKGKGITITGGGDYLSRSFGGQNVTIVGANQAQLTGVTVTNPSPRGYGLWIEFSNPVISENTFTGSTQDGISVTGNAAPTITKNYFIRNGANGITIAGNSQAQVRENVFQQTGFGINIAQQAAPFVVGNQIQYNRSGIVVQADARPTLRNNLIQNSKEDGVVVLSQAIPDLGTAAEPGGNQFRNNGRYDINASAAKQVIAASGNTLTNNRISGKVDLRASSASIAQNSSQQTLANGEIIFSAPGVSQSANTLRAPLPRNSHSQNNIPTGRLNSQLQPLQPANISPRPVSRPNPQPPTSRVNGFPIPSSLGNNQVSRANKPNTPQFNYVRIDPNTIEFTAPQASTPRTQQQSLPRLATPSVGDSALLPVPNSNIGMGNTRNLQKVPVPESYPTGPYGGSLPYAGAPQMGVRYRVIVQVVNERDPDLVRYLVPGAFSTVWQGRSVMQAGVFSSRYNADEMLKVLNTNGLRAMIEPLN